MTKNNGEIEVTEEVKFKRRELRDKVLAIVAVSGIMGGIVVLGPNFPILLSAIISIFKKDHHQDVPVYKVRRVLKTLEKNKIISLESRGEEVYVHVIDRFDTRLIKYSIKALLDLKNKEKRWRGKWYLVTFDIPEKERNKRDYLRNFLKKIGFYKYQKSVYAFPYECEKEVALLKQIVEGGRYINYVVAERIENEIPAKVYFGL
jgi:DNA-binding transcriptional regulator PaaX